MLPSPDWSPVLRALLGTLDLHMGADERAVLLRAIGGRIADLLPIPPEETLSGFEARINERLSGPGWGSVAIELDTAGPSLVLTHRDAPSLGDEGGWRGALLEGLHAAWIAAQPGGEAKVEAKVVGADADRFVLRCGV